MTAPRPILIAGPTASGKSALALTLARRLGGMVINADSQQVYGTWRILTARPTAADETAVAHRLYGHVPLGQEYSVGAWLDDLRPVLAEAAEHGLRPILIGGTGLYFKALTEGLAEIPRTAPATRAHGEAELERLGLTAFAAALARRDPETAARIDLANPARVLRAWEVLEETGTPLARWQSRTGAPLLPLSETLAFALQPKRAAIAERAERRFDQMIAEGVLDEVAAARALGLDPDAPGMRAVGAPELTAHLDGALTLAQAIERAKIATRRYAKRQMTWIRGQMADWPVLESPDPDQLLAVAEAERPRAGETR